MVRDISVTHPVGVAFDAVRTILFTPFDLGKFWRPEFQLQRRLPPGSRLPHGRPE